MKILAIETSAVVASVAIVEGDANNSKVIAEYTINNKLNHSVNLMPMIESMVNQTELVIKELDYIAVASGPGSFTGLRIGSATAKGLAHALNLDIIEVPTLLGMAYNVLVFDGYIIPMMDARRNQVYCAVFESDQRKLSRKSEDNALEIGQLADLIKSLPKKKCIILGDGVSPNEALIRQSFSDIDYIIAPIHMNEQQAGSIGVVALEKALNHDSVGFAEFAPKYIRMSQAERELKERSGGNIS